MSTESLVVIIPTLLALLAVVVALFALLAARSRDGQKASGTQSLEQLLAAPTLRGGVGELVLENMLSQTLPTGSYETQYALRNGNRVDAVIRLANGLVPVDAKFPLESFSRLVEAGDSGHGRRLSQFRRDMRRHVDDIADKYILPGETLDFALMYIPAENVYYETVLKAGSDDDILNYAWKRRVFPTSPNSFFAFLRIVERGLRGIRMEESAREVLDSVDRLDGKLGQFAEGYRKTGTHLYNAQTRYSRDLGMLEDIRSDLQSGLTHSSRVEPRQQDGRERSE